MTIEINEREKQVLAEIFEAAEKELLAGIDHADTRDYRSKLQERLRVVEALQAKVGVEPRSSNLVH